MDAPCASSLDVHQDKVAKPAKLAKPARVGKSAKVAKPVPSFATLAGLAILPTAAGDYLGQTARKKSRPQKTAE